MKHQDLGDTLVGVTLMGVMLFWLWLLIKAF